MPVYAITEAESKMPGIFLPTGRNRQAKSRSLTCTSTDGIIRETITVTFMKNTRTFTFVLAALSLLFVPFFAELFNVEGWDWGVFDYIVVAVLLTVFGASVAYATGPRSPMQRAVGIGLAILILLAYVHLAVGIVDWLPFAGS